MFKSPASRYIIDRRTLTVYRPMLLIDRQVQIIDLGGMTAADLNGGYLSLLERRALLQKKQRTSYTELHGPLAVCSRTHESAYYQLITLNSHYYITLSYSVHLLL